MRARGWVRYPFPLGPLLPAVFLTGATGLVYEIVWARRLSLLLGSTTGAVAAVLSSFMLGMALGAVIVGRRSDSSKRPLRWYGVLEIGIGAYALAFPAILAFLGSLLQGIPWLAAFALLLLPAALMGGTLPVLARAAADTTERGASALGLLYGTNTLGAVAGALLATFVLLEEFGLSGTVRIAAGVNVAVGALFWLLASAAGEREIFRQDEEEAGEERLLGGASGAVGAALLLAGFAGLALQVAWIRLLVHFLEGFTIAFGLMLATYLLGLALGAVGGSLLAGRSAHPRRLLSFLLLLEAVLVASTLLLSSGLSGPLDEARRAQAQIDTIGSRYAVALFFASAKIILPGTLLAGALLPVAARIAMAGRHRIGAHGGGIYAASTVGAVLAPPIAGFLLIPALGVPGTIVACGALLLAAGTLAAMGTGMRGLLGAGGATALFVVACLAGDFRKPLLVRTGLLDRERHPRRLLESKDGLLAAVSVVEDLDSGARSLYLDAFRAAETGRHYGYMRMLAHLPMLLHPEPKEVLVIAFGTGTTAGAASVHPGITRISCVDIEPEVFSVAGRFSAVNREVLSKPFVSAVVADGREFVGREGKPYDVVTLEPLLPNMPGAVYLYTREFYRASRRSLADGGFLCQWIPIHVLAAADFKRLVAAVAAEFEHVSLWYFDQSALVIGGTHPPRTTPADLARRALGEEIASDLRDALVGDAAHLLGAHVASDARLRAALEGTEPLVDDRTVLEFRPLPRGFGARTERFRRETLAWFSSIHEPQIPWMPDADAGTLEAVAEGGALLRLLADPESDPAPLEELVRDRRNALHARSLLQRRAYAALVAEGRFAEAAGLELVPDRSRAFLGLALEPGAAAEERRRYLLLAVRENAVLTDGAERPQAIALLRELASSVPDAEERRFLENRARALEGRPPEEGAEKRPEFRIPDVAERLRANDFAGARLAFDQARLAGQGEAAEESLRLYYTGSGESADAALTLHQLDSRHALRAGLKLSGSKSPEERAVAAKILCARSLAAWETLCGDPSSKVRDEAAQAAADVGTRAHLKKLLAMLEDPDYGVRVSAFAAFLHVESGAEKSGYDPQAPSASSLDALRKLAGP